VWGEYQFPVHNGGTELGGRDGSTPKNCSDREERQDIFSSGQQIYLRLFIDGKILLGVVPSVPLYREHFDLAVDYQWKGTPDSSQEMRRRSKSNAIFDC
jgi:hypothetical protein